MSTGAGEELRIDMRVLGLGSLGEELWMDQCLPCVVVLSRLDEQLE